MTSLIVINNCYVFILLFCSATNEDEMCNFYLMYYVDNEEPLDMKYCFTAGSPKYHWNNTEVGFNNIPDFDASNLISSPPKRD